MVEIMDVLKEGGSRKIIPKPFIPEICQKILDGLKLVYALIVLLSGGKYVVIVPAPNREGDARN